MAHNLVISQAKYFNSLDMMVWDDNGHVHTDWPILYLNNSEVRFMEGSHGGRFHKYNRNLRDNKVSVRVGVGTKPFEYYLFWIAEMVQEPWSFDVEPHDPIDVGGGIGWKTCSYDLNFYFALDDEAVLFLLKFV